MMVHAPDGYAPHFRKSPLTDPWEPLYSKILPDRVMIGLEIREVHCNSRGLVHGGLISALADNAMGLSCMLAHKAASRSTVASLVTASLQVDFLGQAKIGQWLEFDTQFVQAGRTLSFGNAFVLADGIVVARASASFRAVNDTKA